MEDRVRAEDDLCKHELVFPDLGLPEAILTASLWLVTRGSTVNQGDRLLEVLAGDVSVDLPSPASGILKETYVREDEELHVGQSLALIVSQGE